MPHPPHCWVLDHWTCSGQCNVKEEAPQAEPLHMCLCGLAHPRGLLPFAIRRTCFRCPMASKEETHGADLNQAGSVDQDLLSHWCQSPSTGP